MEIKGKKENVSVAGMSTSAVKLVKFLNEEDS